MKKLLLFIAIVAILSSQTSFAQSKYASRETEEVVEKMIQTHGGSKSGKIQKH
tara:strand:+ start:1405 stop:1563 length:159 start_codon:yes stop_codon:yes gene_type:complete